MRSARKEHEIFVLWGPDPEDKEDTTRQSILAVTSEEHEAESSLGEVLFKAAQSHVKALKAGGTCSVFIRRGSRSGDERTYAAGSFVMSNPSGDDEHKRHSWEFEVQRVALDALAAKEEPLG